MKSNEILAISWRKKSKYPMSIDSTDVSGLKGSRRIVASGTADRSFEVEIVLVSSSSVSKHVESSMGGIGVDRTHILGGVSTLEEGVVLILLDLDPLICFNETARSTISDAVRSSSLDRFSLFGG